MDSERPGNRWRAPGGIGRYGRGGFRVGVCAILVSGLVFVGGCRRPADDERAAHEFVQKESWTHDDSPRLIGEFELLLRGLRYDEIIKLPDDFAKVSRERTLPFPDFVATASGAPPTVPLDELHFMQSSIFDEFADPAYDVITLAYQLQRGEMKVEGLPLIHVWQDSRGRVWTLNHRRLAAFLLAGTVDEVPVRWASRERVDQHRFEYTTRVGGRSIVMILNYELGAVISAGSS